MKNPSCPGAKRRAAPSCPGAKRRPGISRFLAPLLASALACALASACASTPEKAPKHSDLDITTQPKSDSTAQVPASAVTNWQAFFKAPPQVAQRSALEKRLDKWTDDSTPKALIEKGRAEVALRRLAFAETSLRKALRLAPNDMDAQLELAALYLRMKDTDKSFEFLAQVREGINAATDVTQTFIFRYRYTLALGYLARNEREKGHKVLSDLIGVDKGFAPAYAALATSYIALGREGVAEFVIRRGLDRAKDSALLLNLMGVIAEKGKLYDEARQWFDKALAAQSTYAPALVNRANISIRGFEFGPAEEDLKQALRFDPLNVDALVALGIVQRKQGNHAAAKSALTKAVDLAPDNAYARFNLGVLLADDLKKPHEALRLFHEVLQTPGENGTGPTAELKALARSYINDLKKVGERY